MNRLRKNPSAASTGDIPPWFMTYSDVVTLLMTFFILLLTFSTHHPETTEKTRVTVFDGSGGTGFVGPLIKKPDPDSWVNRVRSHAARIAMHGAEMPPIEEEPASHAIGQGLKALTEQEDQHNEMTTHFVDIEVSEIIDHNQQLTAKGLLLSQTLASQLQSMPVHASFQISDPVHGPALTAIATHLFHVEMVRPGQVGIGLISADLASTKMRLTIERFNEANQ